MAWVVPGRSWVGRSWAPRAYKDKVGNSQSGEMLPDIFPFLLFLTSAIHHVDRVMYSSISPQRRGEGWKSLGSFRWLRYRMYVCATTTKPHGLVALSLQRLGTFYGSENSPDPAPWPLEKFQGRLSLTTHTLAKSHHQHEWAPQPLNSCGA